MNELLDANLCKKLREVINKTDIFIKDEEENKKFNLVCALMDRFDTTVKYINSIEKIKSEDEFILFMVHVCIIKDGIKYIKEVLNINCEEDSKIFEEIYRKYPIELPEIIEYSDDQFFEYFRSLVFAHPFLTNRSIPNRMEGEIQYSPFIIANRFTFKGENKLLSVKVYSNKRNNSFFIDVPFERLRKYIKLKYEELNEVIEKFENIIKRKETEWKKRKVKRDLCDVEILNDVKSILQERCYDYDIIDELIIYLTCDSTLKENEKSVHKYRIAIEEIIPKLCDAVDNYNHDELYDLTYLILHVTPKVHQEEMNYQLEKIFCYLNEDYKGSEDFKWGLKQAENFANGFAKKWVTIKPYQMDYNEIKMLTRVACYLEYKEKNRRKINEQI